MKRTVVRSNGQHASSQQCRRHAERLPLDHRYAGRHHRALHLTQQGRVVGAAGEQDAKPRIQERVRDRRPSLRRPALQRHPGAGVDGHDRTVGQPLVREDPPGSGSLLVRGLEDRAFARVRGWRIPEEAGCRAGQRQRLLGRVPPAGEPYGAGEERTCLGEIESDAQRDAGGARQQGTPPVVRTEDDGQVVTRAPQARRLAPEEQVGRQGVARRAAGETGERQRLHLLAEGPVASHVRAPGADEVGELGVRQGGFEQGDRRRREQHVAQMVRA